MAIVPGLSIFPIGVNRRMGLDAAFCQEKLHIADVGEFTVIRKNAISMRRTKDMD
jgi:hypothetical protein